MIKCKYIDFIKRKHYEKISSCRGLYISKQSNVGSYKDNFYYINETIFKMYINERGNSYDYASDDYGCIFCVDVINDENLLKYITPLINILKNDGLLFFKSSKDNLSLQNEKLFLKAFANYKIEILGDYIYFHGTKL